MVSTGQASCTWSNKRVCSVFGLLTVAYLGFYFGGGGVKLILGNGGVCMANPCVC